jgi:HD-GYP domain-containing protein (c-di-GMP phosphodiesterase class II)
VSGKQVTTTTPRTVPNKRKSEEEENLHQKKKSKNSRPKRENDEEKLTANEFDMVWMDAMAKLDKLECDDSEAVFDNLEFNKAIVDGVAQEVLKHGADIFLQFFCGMLIHELCNKHE